MAVEPQADGHGQSPHGGEPVRLLQPAESIDARDFDDDSFLHEEVRMMLAAPVPLSSLGTLV